MYRIYRVTVYRISIVSLYIPSALSIEWLLRETGCEGIMQADRSYIPSEYIANSTAKYCCSVITRVPVYWPLIAHDRR